MLSLSYWPVQQYCSICPFRKLWTRPCFWYSSILLMLLLMLAKHPESACVLASGLCLLQLACWAGCLGSSCFLPTIKAVMDP